MSASRSESRLSSCCCSARAFHRKLKRKPKEIRETTLLMHSSALSSLMHKPTSFIAPFIVILNHQSQSLPLVIREQIEGNQREVLRTKPEPTFVFLEPLLPGNLFLSISFSLWSPMLRLWSPISSICLFHWFGYVCFCNWNLIGWLLVCVLCFSSFT